MEKFCSGKLPRISGVVIRSETGEGSVLRYEDGTIELHVDGWRSRLTPAVAYKYGRALAALAEQTEKAVDAPKEGC